MNPRGRLLHPPGRLAGCGTLPRWRQGSEGFGSPPVGTLLIRVPWRQGSEGSGSPPVGTLLMRVPWVVSRTLRVVLGRVELRWGDLGPAGRLHDEQNPLGSTLDDQDPFGSSQDSSGSSEDSLGSSQDSFRSPQDE